MLAATGVSKSHGAHVVLADVDLVVPPGARIGLVGANGAGKSTLLRLLAGLDEPDRGSVRRAPGVSVGFLPQERDVRPGEPLVDYLSRRVGTDIRSRLPRVARELGLDAALDRPVDDLSGGEAARAALAALLLANVDVLLLDEPTNDLDFEGLDRLERHLASFDGAVVVVSHDRAFLDRTVTRIVELDVWTNGATAYTGGWSEYEADRARRRARHYDEWESYVGEKQRIEEQARRMQRWEERGYGQGRKKKKSKDVKKAYEKKLGNLAVVEKPYEPWELRLGLESRSRSGEVVLRLEGALAERGEFRLGPVDLEVSFGDRVAVVGRNGTGKTTLLDVLLGRLPLRAGSRWAGPSVVLGELEQRRGELAGDEPLVDGFVRESGLTVETARTLLAKFDLGAEDVERRAASLSPGERTRAVLALLSARGVNCLVLDEPTNHLDVEAIEELERALHGYDGTVVLVTHDRLFLERFGATRTIEL